MKFNSYSALYCTCIYLYWTLLQLCETTLILLINMFFFWSCFMFLKFSTVDTCRILSEDLTRDREWENQAKPEGLQQYNRTSKPTLWSVKKDCSSGARKWSFVLSCSEFSMELLQSLQILRITWCFWETRKQTRWQRKILTLCQGSCGKQEQWEWTMYDFWWVLEDYDDKGSSE